MMIITEITIILIDTPSLQEKAVNSMNKVKLQVLILTVIITMSFITGCNKKQNAALGGEQQNTPASQDGSPFLQVPGNSYRSY